MKNSRKIYFVLLLLCCLMVPSVVEAATKSKVVLECEETTYDEKEDGVACTTILDVPSDETIAFKSISFKLDKAYLGEAATFEAADEDIVVSGNFENGFTITKKNNETFSSTEDLVKIENITMPGVDKATYEKGQYNYTMKLTDVKLVVSDIESYTGTDYSAKIRLLSTDATLKSITLNGTALEGFNSKATKYKYTTDEDVIKISAVASNQNAEILLNTEDTNTEFTNEIKNKELNLDYGSSTISLSVVSESGIAKVYNIYVFRPYKLFPGYNFDFDSKTNNYTLNVGSDINNFAICSYDEEESKFVSKANTLCMKIDVIEDVYGIQISDSTYYKTLKLNGISLANERESWSDKETFEKMDIVTDAQGNQTRYDILGELKDGANTLKFSINTNYPAYTITINKGGAANDSNSNAGSAGDKNTSNSSNGNNSSNSNTSTGYNNTVEDGTVDNPKTGIVTYTLIILAAAGLAGGAYYFLKKKNIIKKI